MSQRKPPRKRRKNSLNSLFSANLINSVRRLYGPFLRAVRLIPNRRRLHGKDLRRNNRTPRNSLLLRVGRLIPNSLRPHGKDLRRNSRTPRNSLLLRVGRLIPNRRRPHGKDLRRNNRNLLGKPHPKRRMQALKRNNYGRPRTLFGVCFRLANI